jgi:twitching motility protein PilT
MMDIKELLKYTADNKASDLHLSSTLQPKVRIDGDLRTLEEEVVLSEDNIKSMLKEILSEEQYAEAEKSYEMDLAIDLPNVARFRVNIFHQLRGISVAFRTIPVEVQSLDELNMPETLKKLCELPKGLVLVTGPTGTGKSTTLAAMVDYVNQNRSNHILTIEDPIEFVHKSKSCLVQQREVHHHTESFGDALRSALREDPDVILVGEMRDLETIRLALTAAETGHLVFATLHTSSAAKTVNRVIDVFPAGEKDLIRTILSVSLQAVVSQILLKRVGGGRVAVQEILLCTPAIRNLIRENKVPQIDSSIQTGRALGMKTLEQDLEDLIQKGTVDIKTAQNALMQADRKGIEKEAE